MTDAEVDRLLHGYVLGTFPMGEARDDDRIFIVNPHSRAVLPLDALNISSRLARTIRSDRYEVRVDTAFAQVVEHCATPAPGREDTWINAPLTDFYARLFDRGNAHSVECWRDGRLVGGLYGVSLNAAFFGESMYSHERDASKVALAHLAARLRVGGYRLLDAQFMTDHLASLGAIEINRAAYRVRLKQALAHKADFAAIGPAVCGAHALQAISQAS